MSLLDLILLAVAVSMDAFSVAICKGLSLQTLSWKPVLIVGAYFGLFQALMPLLGYFAGAKLASFIENIDHWIAFILLAILGIQMIHEARTSEACPVGDFSFKSMFPLAIATSIDALAVGVTLAFLKVNILSTVLFIGAATFGFSCLGVVIGNYFGQRFEKPAQIFGGLVLIFIGSKILVEHLGLLG